MVGTSQLQLWAVPSPGSLLPAHLNPAQIGPGTIHVGAE